MPRYKAAIFDLDGTLLDTLGDLADGVNEALSHFGYPLRTQEEVRRFVGNGVHLLIARALPAGTEEARIGEVLAYFKEYYAAHAQVKTAPYRGVCEMLASLGEAGVRVCVVSNKFDAAVRELCAFYFGDAVAYAAGERVGTPKKPAPDGILAAMEAVGVDASDAVYIGDSEVDVQTAKNAGIAMISVLWGFRDREEMAAEGAVTFVASVEELSALLLAD